MCLWNRNAPREWQSPWTAMPLLKIFKSKSNDKVTMSNHLFHYRSNITKNDHKPWKGLVTRNSHMKYPSPGTYYSIQYIGQTSRPSSQDTNGRVVSQGILKCNIKVVIYTIQKIQPRLNFTVRKSNIKVKVRRTNLLVPNERICHYKHSSEISKS
jgi:hypothetical protein